MASTTGRFRELFKKYGKVALGVHFSVSAASITGLYIAIKSNVDVESLFHKVGIGAIGNTTDDQHQQDAELISDTPTPSTEKKKKNRTAELAASSGGALALAVLCNKALFPIRVPITIALTPPIARFLARKNILSTGL